MEIRRGLLDDPRWLAAAIGGIVSAIAALWAMRGLPLGFAAFWLTSLPIFAAGLGFGSGSAFGALCVGTVMVLVLASEWPALIYLLGFALPALLMVATGLRAGRLDASVPMALTGIWPALVILLVAVLLADTPGGFDGALIGSVQQGLRRMGIADAGMPVEQLARIKKAGLRTKTGFMVGLGETPEEVRGILADLQQCGVDVVTIGQYLQPTKNHLPVQEYIRPEQFELYASWGLEMGLEWVEAGPLVRSSYHAERHLHPRNAGATLS